MTRIFKYRHFVRWAKSEAITNDRLKQVVTEMEAGLYEGNLGSGLYKKRVASFGQGKRGAYRLLLAYRVGERVFFLYGYAKNEKANINIKEREVFRKLTTLLLELNETQLVAMVREGSLIEVA